MSRSPRSQLRPHAGEPRRGSAEIVLRRPVAVLCLVATALVAAWAGLLTWYAFGRDDFVRRFIAREAELKADYDEKIGLLRTRLDQVRTQKLVEQDGLEKRLTAVAERQAAIEARQGALAALARDAGAGGPKIHTAERTGTLTFAPADATAQPAVAPTGARTAKPIPMPSGGGFGLRMREPDTTEATATNGPRAEAPIPAGVRVAALERAADEVAAAQAGAVSALLTRSRQESERLRTLIAGLGLGPDQTRELEVARPVGGPLVPVSLEGAGGGAPLASELDVLRKSLAELDRWRRLGASLPLARPTPADVEVTSGFGYRLDPFTRSPALHTGIDLRAETGSPVRATGAGRVVAAEHTGGYGYMVEIDHGNRVATRYAHLSTIEVAPGQSIAPGTIVGRVGSTGRSTGAHLHYETRIDGEPVDPRRFLGAQTRLASVSPGGG